MSRRELSLPDLALNNPDSYTESTRLLGPNDAPRAGPSSWEEKTPMILKLTKGVVHPSLDLQYAWIRIEDVPDVGISNILHECNEMVLKIIDRRLAIVGWRPVFPIPDNKWHRLVNVVHPMAIVLVILLTLIIQACLCFKRSGYLYRHYVLDESSNSTIISCHDKLLVDYVIPDILSSVAYCYSFYVLRGSQCEQIQSLLQKVFLQASTMDSGYMTQKSLVKSIRMVQLGCNMWIVLSLLAQTLHSVDSYQQIPPYDAGPGVNVGKVVMLAVMLAGFVLFDMVYTTVIINYTVQCILLIYYARGLKEKILSKNIELQKAIGTVYDIKATLHMLNRHAALVTSVILLNFCSYGIRGVYAISQGSQNPLIYFETGLASFLWLGMVAFPVIQAMRLTGACNSLRAVGVELRTRPYYYRSTPTAEIDSFIAFLSNTSLQAKLFLAPVRVSFVLPFLSAVLFILLLLAQLEVKLYIGPTDDTYGAVM